MLYYAVKEVITTLDLCWHPYYLCKLFGTPSLLPFQLFLYLFLSLCFVHSLYVVIDH